MFDLVDIPGDVMAKNASIDRLNLSPRVTTVLKRDAGVVDAKGLAKWTKEGLTTLHNLGENDIPSIRKALKKLGLDLAQ